MCRLNWLTLVSYSLLKLTEAAASYIDTLVGLPWKGSVCRLNWLTLVSYSLLKLTEAVVKSTLELLMNSRASIQAVRVEYFH